MPCNKTLTKFLFFLFFAVMLLVSYLAPFNPALLLVLTSLSSLFGVPCYLIMVAKKHRFAGLVFYFVVILPPTFLLAALLKLGDSGNLIIVGI